MAQAIVLREYGGPEALKIESIEVGRPGAGELRIRHTAIGVNFHDVYVRSGLYKTLALPGVPGIEAAGVIEDVNQSLQQLTGRDEAALKGRPYTILNGHLHRYSYSQLNGADHIMLGTTGGERSFDGSAGGMDHFMWITMTKDGPRIANLRLDGVLDKTGHVPANGERLCITPKC